MALDLITVGEYYNDLIFYRLPRPPRLGEEVKTAHFARSPGGGAVITAAAARRLGLRVGVVTVVGDNNELHALRREGLDTSRCSVDPKRRGAVTVAVSTVRDRYFLTSEGPNAEFQKLVGWRRVYPYLAAARHVHFAFQPQDAGEAASWLARLRRDGVTTSLDVGWDPKLLAARRLRDLVQGATSFFPNWTEARAITGATRLEAALEALAEWVEMPVVKLGGRGAAAWDHGSVVRSAAPKVRMVDSTGAGDAFNGGFLYGYLRGLPVARCLELGNFCGARAATAPGGLAGLPRRKNAS
jgi:sugar/nucleoside kinase (ribokinase family)